MHLYVFHVSELNDFEVNVGVTIIIVFIHYIYIALFKALKALNKADTTVLQNIRPIISMFFPSESTWRAIKTPL